MLFDSNSVCQFFLFSEVKLGTFLSVFASCTFCVTDLHCSFPGLSVSHSLEMIQNSLHCSMPYDASKDTLISPRWGGKESSAGHPHRHCLLSPHLFCRLLWCVCCSYYDDAVLHAGQEKPNSCGLQICRLGGSHLCSGCGLSVCPLHQVSVKLSSYTCKQMLHEE